MGKIIKDATGQAMLSIMRRQLAVMELQAADKMAELTTNLAEIHELVRSGVAHELLDFGDRVNVTWKDTEDNQEHVAPHNIVHFGDVELEDGETLPGMFLQWHYCTPYGIPFDAPEALYYASAELPAGTYNFTIPTTWSKAVAGTYQFTLTQAIPAGGQIGPIAQIADKDPSTWSVTTYTGPTDTTGIETVAVTSGSAGTSLGELKPAGDGNLNSIQRVGYGYNRWSQSAVRQWLNSAAGPGAWWTPQNNWDRPPAEAATKSGFLAGYGEDFLACIKPVKVVTALNTVTDSGDGTTETTFDKIFLPSLQQIYTEPQLADVEGDAWEYWKRALGLTAYSQHHPAVYEVYKTYAINAKTAAQYCRLRSAYRGLAYYTWYVNAGGYVTNHSAYYATRCAPACVIC